MFNNVYMSHIAYAIKNLLQEKGKTAAELARSSGIPESQISRFLSGSQIWVSPKGIADLTNGFHPNKGEAKNKVHAQLLHAHLLDEAAGPGAKYITISLSEKVAPEPDSPKSATPILPPHLQENLDLISQHISTNKHVRALVESIADLCRNSPKTPSP